MVAPTRSRRRAFLALAAAALAVAVVWMAWSTLTSRPAIESAAPRPASPIDVASPDAGASTPARDASHHAFEAPATVAAATTVARRVVGADDPSLIAVEVIVREQATGAPVSDAEVFYPTSEDDLKAQLAEAMYERGLGLELFRRIANTSRTNEDGLARLRCRPGNLELFAVSSSMWGGADFAVDGSLTEPLTIYVQPAVYVAAQVVDETGRPLVGIPVSMRKKVHGFLDFRYGAFTSGRAGVAQLGPLDADERELWVVGIDGALTGKASAELDIRELPTEPVRLVLPAHGSVEVRITSADGKPFAGSAAVELAWMIDGEWCAHTLCAVMPPGSGAAEFERVGLDLGVRAEAKIAGISHSFEVDGRGPRRAGERVVVELKLGRALSVLAGRAVDEFGEPLRNRELRLSGHLRNSHPAAFEAADVMTDAGGNFALAIDSSRMARVEGALLLRNVHSEPELGAAVRIQLSAGRKDLGSITFAPARTIATGIVVDENGAPVSEAMVMLAPEQELTDTARGWAIAVRSGTQGEFDLRGWAGDGLVRILAKHRKRSGIADVPLGSQGERLAIAARHSSR